MKARELLRRLPHWLPGRRAAGFVVRLVWLPALIVLVAAGLAFAVDSAFTRVPPGRIAVRQLNWGGGLDDEVVGTGLYFGLRGLVSWHFLDTATHVLEFLHKPGDPKKAALVIRTKDNNTVRVEATVTYRIVPEEAPRLVEKGLELDYDAHARNAVKNVLRKELATLDSSAWIDTEQRLARVEEIRDVLDETFASFHLECDEVLLRSVAFPPAFEEELQKKQIQHQKALLFEAQRGLQEVQGEVGAYREETAALVARESARLDAELAAERSGRLVELAELRTRATAERAAVRSEARRRARELQDEGRAALDTAEAEAESSRLTALGGEGGRLLLAARAARALRLEEVEVDAADHRLPPLLDLDAMVRLLAGEPPER